MRLKARLTRAISAQTQVKTLMYSVPMNIDVAPPWALDANAGASDSANTLQCKKELPEMNIIDC